MRFLRSPHVHASLCAATIAVLMMLPAGAFPEFRFWLPLTLEQWIDKIQHVIAFMVMTVFVARSLNEFGWILRPVLMAAVLTLGFSSFLEVMQALVPWRYFDLRDIVADTVGVLLAVPMATRVVRSRIRRLSPNRF